MREFGSDINSLIITDHYFKRLFKQFKVSYLLRTGREALFGIINSFDKQNRIVLLPSYLCPSMLDPFEEADCNIVFYNIKKDFNIDLDDLIDKIRKFSPKVILTMNYFGLSNTSYANKIIKSVDINIKIIEDVTHLLFRRFENENVDFYMASIRKWIGIADGGVVLTNQNIKLNLNISDPKFVSLRFNALSLKNDYLITKDQTIKQTYKELINKSNDLVSCLQLCKMSDMSMKQIYSVNGSEINYIRTQNIKHLYEILKDHEVIKYSKKYINYEKCTFMFPILLNNKNVIQRKLASLGLYTQSIWKIPIECRSFKDSVFISDKILCIPIDQRYDYNEISEIGLILLNNLDNGK